MGMGFDGEVVVEEGGRVTLTGLPYEAGRTVRFHFETPEEANARAAAETGDALDKLAEYLHEKYPKMPVLSDEALSRESIYEDCGI